MTPQEATQNLWQAVADSDVSAAQVALAAGAEVNARNQWQQTPLHLAADTGHTDLARLLIEKGAEVNAKDDEQQMPLHWAANNGYTEIVKLLEDAARHQGGYAGRVAKGRGNDEPQIGG